MQYEYTPDTYDMQLSETGILVLWERFSENTVAFYQILRADYIDAEYTTISTVPFPGREYVDPFGHPNYYYRIQEVLTNGTNGVLSNPIPGAELVYKEKLIYNVDAFMCAPIHDEPPIFDRSRKSCRFTFGNWNQFSEVEIRISSANTDGSGDPFTTLDPIEAITSTQVDSNGDPVNNYPNGLRILLDYNGKCSFIDNDNTPVAIDPADTILGTYSVRLFSYSDLNQMLMLALQTLNAQPGSNKYFAVSQTPFWYESALIDGATFYLLRQLSLQMTMRERRLLLQDPENGAYDALGHLEKSIDRFEKSWEDHIKKIPIAQYPEIRSIVIPEFNLPGGRSRYFRQIWKQSG